jgi:predicted ATPase
MSWSASPTEAAHVTASELRCGELLIDRRTRRICNLQGEPVALGSRAFDLLLALIDGGSEPLPADALRAKVWRGRTMADNNLRVQITQLRRQLGRDAVLYRPGVGYQLTARVEQRRPEAAPTPPAVPGNLPDSPWAVLGRDALLQQLCARLSEGSRVTLVGPAGVGKTTLALAAAQRVGPAVAHFPDGAWWVELAPLHDPQQLARSVTAALQMTAAREQPLQRLVSALSGKRLLLVLDNCEHLRAAVAELSDRLLRGAPGVSLLATSRVALGSAGEHLLSTPELSLPAAGAAADWAAVRGSGAATVFEARARAVDQRFRLTPENAPLVADICRRLDGNAFAIALAAAQVPVLGLLRLRDRLDKRLRWMQRRGGGGAAHQLSLQATLDWTHALLPAGARLLLRRLGVFSGHFDFEAVAAVAAVASPLAPAALDDALGALVAHGLVSIDSAGLLGRDGAGARYTMHESVRLYARQLLEGAAELDSVQGALARWLLQCLRADPQLARQEFASPALVQQLMGDVQPAVLWAATHDAALGAALVNTCSYAWRRLGLHALLERLCALLMPHVVEGGHTEARLDLLFSLMGNNFELQRHDEVIAQPDTALALMEGSEARPRYALALSWKANVLGYSQGAAAAEPLYWQALALYRACGDSFGLRQSLNNLGWALQEVGRAAEARALLQEALDLNSRVGDDWDLMVSHENLGELELAAGQHAVAACHFERESVLARRLPDAFRLALSLLCLTLARLGPSGSTVPTEPLREAMEISLKQDFPRLQADVASVLALLLSRRGEHRLAISTLAFASALRTRRQLVAPGVVDRAEAEVRRCSEGVLAPQESAALRAQGALLTLRELVERIEAGKLAT